MTRVAFLGTPRVAVPALRQVAATADLEVVAVVTNPDRPRGRSSQPKPPPVKQAATDLDLRVLQPERPADAIGELEELDLDVAAVVAYGAILPPEVLGVPRTGFVNLHFSLLPRWRGAAPVQHTIMAGDDTTGVTTFLLDEGMDTGPVLERVEVPVEPGETAGELLERLAELGPPVLVRSLAAVAAGEADPTPQDDDAATLAPKLDPGDVAVDWTAPARRVVDLVHGANPRPGAHTTRDGDRLKLWRAETAGGDAAGGADPGTIVTTDGDGPVIAAGSGAVRLLQLQPEGKQAMSGGDFVNGYQPEPGSRLGT